MYFRNIYCIMKFPHFILNISLYFLFQKYFLQIHVKFLPRPIRPNFLKPRTGLNGLCSWIPPCLELNGTYFYRRRYRSRITLSYDHLHTGATLSIEVVIVVTYFLVSSFYYVKTSFGVCIHPFFYVRVLQFAKWSLERWHYSLTISVFREIEFENSPRVWS